MSYIFNFIAVFSLASISILFYFIYRHLIRVHNLNVKRDTIYAMNGFLHNIKEERLWMLSESNTKKLVSPNNLLPDEVQVAEQFLGAVERLALGARYGVYDTVIIKNTSRRFLASSFELFFPYIKEKRKKFNNDSIFEHYEWLMGTLE